MGIGGGTLLERIHAPRQARSGSHASARLQRHLKISDCVYIRKNGSSSIVKISERTTRHIGHAIVSPCICYARSSYLQWRRNGFGTEPISSGHNSANSYIQRGNWCPVINVNDCAGVWE